MASGNQHDKATLLWSLPFGIAIASVFGLKNGFIGSLAFIFGGLWLSPDLDTRSNSFNRWGLLRIFWVPYSYVIPHRSILSHGPIIGSLLRISYLIIIIALGFYICQNYGLISNAKTMLILEQIMKINHNELIVMIIGVEASSWLHLIQDGDP